MREIIALIVVLWIGSQLWQCAKGKGGEERPPAAVPSGGAIRAAPVATPAAAAKRLEEMSGEERRQLAAWGNGTKRAYVQKTAELEERLEGRLEDGYRWGEESLRRARAALEALNRAIDRDEWQNAGARYEEAMEALRLFEAGCRWTPGMRHSRYGHIQAAREEGFWNADEGWVFPRQGSLEVARVCGRCGGDGVEEAWVDCSGCNGTGKVETPLSGPTKLLGDFANVLDAGANALDAAKGKRVRRSGGGGRVSGSWMTCPDCNGKRRVWGERECTRCHGRGHLG